MVSSRGETALVHLSNGDCSQVDLEINGKISFERDCQVTPDGRVAAWAFILKRGSWLSKS